MVLRALVNGAQPLRMGYRHPDCRSVMTDEQALELVKEREAQAAENETAPYYVWDYVWGKPIKSDLSTVLVSPLGYDRDQGDGAMAEMIADLRKELA